MATDRKPLGYESSRRDWNEAFSGRPMNIGDWNSLTLGEQRRYAASECKTKGAIYNSKICADRIDFSVELPASLRLNGLTSDEAASIERQLHKVLEDRIAIIIQHRDLLAQIKAEDHSHGS